MALARYYPCAVLVKGHIPRVILPLSMSFIKGCTPGGATEEERSARSRRSRESRVGTGGSGGAGTRKSMLLMC